MSNHDMIIRQNPDLALGQGRGTVMSQSHTLGLAHGLGLGHNHDSGLVLGYHQHNDRGNDRASDLVQGKNNDPDPGFHRQELAFIEHPHDSGQVLGYTHGNDYNSDLILGKRGDPDRASLASQKHDQSDSQELALTEQPRDNSLILGYQHPHDHGSNHSSDLVLGRRHEPDSGFLSSQNHGSSLSDGQESAFIERPHDSGLILGYHHPHDHDNGHNSDLILGRGCDPGPGSLASQNHDDCLSDGRELSLIEQHGLEDEVSTLDLITIDQNHELTFTTNELALQTNQEMLHNQQVSYVQQRPVVVSPGHELTVGQEFADVQSCRRALRDAAIACNFEMQTVKSDKTRFTAKCAAEGCPWRIHCAKLPGMPAFTIRTIHGTHTCGGIAHLGHHQASVGWVASTVEERLRENPQCKPKEILEEIHRMHGITLSYKQAWRGKERIMATVRESFEEGYHLLPLYCEQIRRVNPGSIALVHGNSNDNCFKCLFISYYASIHGFVNGCRPLIGLDRILLKSKYLGTLLLATGFDGQGALFPLAFGVVDKESDENWIWFLSELHALLEANTENMPRLTILSDHQQGIVRGVDFNFPTAFHGICMRHLSESFHKELNNSMLVNLLWEAAQALTPSDFENKVLEIESVSQEAALWIKRSPYRLWATAYFEGMRFGHMTANIAEYLNSWILEAPALPIIQMMESIRRQLMTWFNERREVSMQWSTILVPSVEQHVSDALERVRDYHVVKANDSEFEINSLHEGTTHIVDIRNRLCLCRGWQVYGLPCVHGVAALLHCRQNVHRYTETYFTVATYRKTYSETIHPIPDKSLWKELSEGTRNKDRAEIVINPPKSLRPPGNPRKRRVRTEDHGRTKRVVHCSRCNQTGHFRTTCSAPI